MYGTVRDQLRVELDEIEAAGLTKRERGIHGPQSSQIEVGGREVLNFCANNYLGPGDLDLRGLRAVDAALALGEARGLDLVEFGAKLVANRSVHV